MVFSLSQLLHWFAQEKHLEIDCMHSMQCIRTQSRKTTPRRDAFMHVEKLLFVGSLRVPVHASREPSLCVWTRAYLGSWVILTHKIQVVSYVQDVINRPKLSVDFIKSLYMLNLCVRECVNIEMVVNFLLTSMTIRHIVTSDNSISVFILLLTNAVVFHTYQMTINLYDLELKISQCIMENQLATIEGTLKWFVKCIITSKINTLIYFSKILFFWKLMCNVYIYLIDRVHLLIVRLVFTSIVIFNSCSHTHSWHQTCVSLKQVLFFWCCATCDWRDIDIIM